MEIHAAVAHTGIFGALDDVLFKGRALQMPISVKLEQTFRQVAVAHVLVLEEEVDDGGEVAAVHIVAKVGLVFFHAVDEVVEEGEGADVLNERFDFGMLLLDLVVDAEIGGGKGVEVFEHARCGT